MNCNLAHSKLYSPKEDKPLNLNDYKKQKLKTTTGTQSTRAFCQSCWQPDFNCFCEQVRPFDPNIEFVILIHPIESRRRMATGRMAHLGLANSQIIRGSGFANCPRINKLLENNSFDNFVLSPGLNSVNLSHLSENELTVKFGTLKKIRIFVLDGTWANAGKMLTRTPKLVDLPRICFTPNRPSNFRVRKQPHANCVSTIEAIHQTIELLAPYRHIDTTANQHDQLLQPFNWMVEEQIVRIKKNTNWRIVENRK